MSLKLSVLDQVPIGHGRSSSGAIADAVELAQMSDRLGYHRYWIAEHHNTPCFASPCPEALLPIVADRTKRIRVGSGGVLLTHYSPYKVAETFAMLGAIAPGRIDLGIGRSRGGNPAAASALAFPNLPNNPDAFEMLLDDLVRFVRRDLPSVHPSAKLRLLPQDVEAPQLWLLGSSGETAALAGRLAMGYGLAFFIGNQERDPAVIHRYRDEFVPAPGAGASRSMIAVTVVCADTAEQAGRIAASQILWKLSTYRHDRIENLLAPAAALNTYETLSMDDRRYCDQLRNLMIIGDPEECRDQLLNLADRYDADEAIIVNVTYSFEDRIRSYELLADAFGLASQTSAVAGDSENGRERVLGEKVG